MNEAPRPAMSGGVGALGTLIAQVGFPVVVAGALLWFLLTRFQSNMDAITTRMEANTEVASGFIATQQQEIAELQKQTAELQQQTQTMRTISDKLERMIGATTHGKGD